MKILNTNKSSSVCCYEMYLICVFLIKTSALPSQVNSLICWCIIPLHLGASCEGKEMPFKVLWDMEVANWVHQ